MPYNTDGINVWKKVIGMHHEVAGFNIVLKTGSFLNNYLFKMAAWFSQWLPSKPHDFVCFKLAQMSASGRVIKEVSPSVYLNLDLNDWLQRLYYLGIADKRRLKFIKSLVPVGGVFIDIGANVGLYTCVISRHVGKNGEVHAFEPMLECLDQLYQNIELNHFNNITVYDVALSNEKKVLNLYVPPLHPGGASGATQVFNPGGWKVAGQVSCIQLDQIYSCPKIDFMKIDVQGHEFEVLEGAVKSINQCQPIILCEVDDYNREKVFKIMESLKYKIFIQDKNEKLSADLPEGNGQYDFFFFPSKDIEAR